MTTVNMNGWRREDTEPTRSGLISSQPNFNDLKSRISNRASRGAPSDMRRYSPRDRHDQLLTSSCVTNCMTRALENKRIQEKYWDGLSRGLSEASALTEALTAHVALSRLALYFLCREAMSPNETYMDEGTYLSVCADILERFGVSREEKDPNNPSDRAFWPFEPSKIFTSPTWAAMREAAVHRCDSWFRITSTGADRVEDVQMNLAAGNPVCFGTTVDSQWDQSNSKNIIGKSSRNIRGRHATMLAGWDPSGFFWSENSWGNDWGVDGFGKISPDVVESDESSDYIVILGGTEDFLKI